MPNSFRASWWLGNRHLHTIYAALRGKLQPRLHYRRERWSTPDGDFVDVDFYPARVSTRSMGEPLLVLFHGLEGSSFSHYAAAFARATEALGWRFAVPHFRGCSGVPNRLPRAYHSGDSEEIAWLLERRQWWVLATPALMSVPAVGLTPAWVYPAAFWVLLLAITRLGLREGRMRP